MKQDQKSGLYVPGQKLPVRVQEMAWQLFVRSWDRYVEADYGSTRASRVPLDVDEVYRSCVEAAKLCFAIEDKEQ